MKYAIFLISLSMMAGILLVNASAEDSPTVNHPAKKTDLQDSIKDTKSQLSRLIETVSKTGEQKDFPNGFAQAVGLSEPMPAKRCHTWLSGKGKIGDDRHVFVVYSTENPARPFCMFLMRGHASKNMLRQEFFRVNLDGQLEKVITLQNKRDENGKSLVEGRARIEEDVEDPEVRKTFQKEMSYWLKDWLKTQPKLAATTATNPSPTAQ